MDHYGLVEIKKLALEIILFDIQRHAAFDYQKFFKNALKTAYLDHYGLVEIKKFALVIILFEIPLIQVEGFFNLK